MSSQTIYADLKSGDNKKMWAYAQELAEFRRKSDKIKDVNIDFSDKESVQQQVMEHLLQQTANGNAASAKELARLLGLGEATQDIVIETVDFAEATWQID
jgi:O6-methylguanine-DNA--protein-cysteine methyltransferase|tara:strand:+ start:776 stop:1075 length:300 start_codon:yes stop_codon:yes gene_type:complete